MNAKGVNRKMTVREATEDDIFDVTFLLKQFAREAPDMYVFDKEQIETVLGDSLLNPDYTLLVSEEKSGEVSGCLLGAVVTPLISNKKVSVELAWYVSKEYRGAGRQALSLMNSFENWSKSKQVEYMVMSDIKGVGDLTKLYEKRGFTLVESSFTKRVV